MRKTRLVPAVLSLLVLAGVTGCPSNDYDMRRIYIANMTGDTILQVYIAEEGSNDWGPNLLLWEKPDMDFADFICEEGPWQLRIVVDRPDGLGSETSELELYDITVPAKQTFVIYAFASDAPMALPSDPHYTEGLYAETDVWPTVTWYAMMNIDL